MNITIKQLREMLVSLPPAMDDYPVTGVVNGHPFEAKRVFIMQPKAVHDAARPAKLVVEPMDTASV